MIQRRSVLALIPALVITSWVAVWLAGFLAEDACYDRSGAVLNGLCHSGEGRIEALDYSFTTVGWFVFGVLASFPGAIIYTAIRAISGRLHRA